MAPSIALQKKNVLTLSRDKEKMEKVLGGIAQLGRVPAALFIVDIGHEHIALAEAKRLGITTFGVVDTNCDPNKVDFAIPANDDATKSIAIITNYITAAIAEGLLNARLQKKKKLKIQLLMRRKRKQPNCLLKLKQKATRGGRTRSAGGVSSRWAKTQNTKRWWTKRRQVAAEDKVSV